MAVFDNLIKEFIAGEVLCNDVPFIGAFEILVDFDDVGVVEFF
jgi:hypothetical protein